MDKKINLSDAAAPQAVALTDEQCKTIDWILDFLNHDGFHHEAKCLRALLASTPAPATADALTDAARDVLAERRRQVEQEGWTPEHDDKLRDHELSCAGGCYAMYTLAHPIGFSPLAWPWAEEWWKPTDNRRNLIKAGALILAEIERLDRAALSRSDKS